MYIILELVMLKFMFLGLDIMISLTVMDLKKRLVLFDVKNFLQHFGSLLLISVLLIKSSAFHIYEHTESTDDANNHCELCVLTLDGQHAESLVPAIEVVKEIPSFTYVKPKIVFTGIDYKNSDIWSILHSRPPPQV